LSACDADETSGKKSDMRVIDAAELEPLAETGAR
jgi:hypothetical protein